MPTVNIFYTDSEQVPKLRKLSAQLKSYLANELSTSDMHLSQKEVSIRLIEVLNAGMIADIEIEVTAHASKGHTKNQDKIATNIREFSLDKMGVSDIRVWLLLPQLGHSW